MPALSNHLFFGQGGVQHSPGAISTPMPVRSAISAGISV
jgi:hypothetical protein